MAGQDDSRHLAPLVYAVEHLLLGTPPPPNPGITFEKGGEVSLCKGRFRGISSAQHQFKTCDSQNAFDTRVRTDL
jgi:hypothetical protein